MGFPSLLILCSLPIFHPFGCSSTSSLHQNHCYSNQMDCSNSTPAEQFIRTSNNAQSNFPPIKSISDNSSDEYDLSKMPELDPSHKKLDEMPKFNHLQQHLKRSNLSHNQSDLIPEIDFKNLSFPEKIDLSGNKLKIFPQLLHISNLKVLHLDDNLIEVIPPFAFHNSSTTLEILSLANNRLSRIQSILLIRLEILNLAQNPLVEVPREVLNEVASTLVMLNVSSTLIAKIRSDDFANLPAIQEIDLCNSKITTIDEGSFRNLPKLQKLYLNDNPGLMQIHYGAFQLLPSLTLIHLHNCNLSTLHDLNLRPELPSLENLTLYGNPLLCHCNLTWLQHFEHILMNRKTYQTWHNSEIVRKCPVRRIGSSTIAITAEPQKLAVICDMIDNNGTNAVTMVQQLLIFEKIIHGPFDTYQCLAYSSETGFLKGKISVDITTPSLRLQMLWLTSITAHLRWFGELPSLTNKLHVRFRSNTTELLFNVTMSKQHIVVPYYPEMFPSTIIEFCLLDGDKELVCDYFDTHENDDDIFFNDNLGVLAILICFAIIFFILALSVKLQQVNETIDSLRMKVNHTWQSTSTEILTKSSGKIKAECSI